VAQLDTQDSATETLRPQRAVEPDAPATVAPDAVQQPQHPTPSLALMREAFAGADAGPALLHAARVQAHAAGITYDPWASNRELADLVEGQTVSAALALARRSSSKPLPPAVRDKLERAFDHDFSHVRVHTDSSAAQAADALSAHAFALGADVFFGPGEYAPDTSDGDRLLVHELTHVVQHDQGRLPGGGGVSSPSDPAEQEAYANERSLTPLLDAPAAELAAPSTDAHAAPPTDANAAPSTAAPSTDVPVHRDAEGAADGAAEEELDPGHYSVEEVEGALAWLTQEHQIGVHVYDAGKGERCFVEFTVPAPEGGWPKELTTRGDEVVFDVPTEGLITLSRGLAKLYDDDAIRYLAGLALAGLDDSRLATAWDEELPVETSGTELMEDVPDTHETDDDLWLAHLGAAVPLVAETWTTAAEAHEAAQDEMSNYLHIQLPGQKAPSFQEVTEVWSALARLHDQLERMEKPLEARLEEDAAALGKLDDLDDAYPVSAALVSFWVDELTAEDGLFNAARTQLEQARASLKAIGTEDMAAYYEGICRAYREVWEAVSAVQIHYQGIENLMIHRTQDLAAGAKFMCTVRDELWGVLFTMISGFAGNRIRQIKWLAERGLTKATAYVAGVALDTAGKAVAGLANDLGDGKPTDWKKLLTDQAIGQVTGLVPKITGKLGQGGKDLIASIDRSALSKAQNKVLDQIASEGFESIKAEVDTALQENLKAHIDEALGRGDGSLPKDFDEKLLKAIVVGAVKRKTAVPAKDGSPSSDEGE